MPPVNTVALETTTPKLPAAIVPRLRMPPEKVETDPTRMPS
jgi:hypothetical protein